MRRVVEQRGLALEIDSAGTGDWHIGDAPDPRAVAAANAGGVDIGSQRARQLQAADFANFDLICVMDAANEAKVQRLGSASQGAHVRLFRDFVPGNDRAELADPYFGDEAGFALSWEQAVEAAEALADWIESNAGRGQTATKSTIGS